jgi:UDP-galactopyranose mutase
MYDYIVVGAGFAGAVIAEEASRDGKSVLLIDRREHIGGNMYDFTNELGIISHKYGPHLFHTNSEEAYNYLKGFSEMFHYEHQVQGYVDGKLVPIPFNLISIEELFGSSASSIKDALLDEYGEGEKVPILELMQSENLEIRELANFVYEKVFKHYTMKQWGLLPEEIDPNVTKRVPVLLSRDRRYFQDKFQFMPKGGYTKLFERMLDSQNITIKLGVDSKDVITLDGGDILFNGEKFEGQLIFTGSIDELFEFRFGELPYRSIKFAEENHQTDSFQPCGTVNYPTPTTIHNFTRISEFKKFTTDSNVEGVTTTVKEYPVAFDRASKDADIPYYPIFTDENREAYNRYLELCKEYRNLHLLGRLAEYKYYNMDQIIVRALEYYREYLQ